MARGTAERMACSTKKERDEVADQQRGVVGAGRWKEEEGRRWCLGQAFLTKSGLGGESTGSRKSRQVERGEGRAAEARARARATPLSTACLAPTSLAAQDSRGTDHLIPTS